MNRTTLMTLIAAVALVAASCNTSTKMMETWRDPTYTPHVASKVLVIGLGINDRQTHMFESIMGEHLGERKVTVVPGSTVMPKDSVQIEELKKIVQNTGSELAIVTRLKGVETEKEYVPGTTAYVPTSAHYGFYPYYYSSYALVHTPGYVTEYKVFKVETNVYDVKDAKLIWSGLSRTADPTDPSDAMHSLAAAVVRELNGQKLIP